MLSEFEIKNNLRWENHEMCERCNGHCCQQTACPCSPSDFNNNINNMYEALKSGNYSIDFIRDSADSFVHRCSYVTLDIHSVFLTPGEALYIRPKNVNCPTVDIIHPEELKTPCMFWTPYVGCAFSYEDRPKFGRAVVPIAPGCCNCIFDTEEIADEWKPYTFHLFRFAKEFFLRNWEPYARINFIL